jgi:DNA-binding MarR family transcriptional regulator
MRRSRPAIRLSPAGTRLTLERRGWVERRPDPTDRRARLVCLTPEGRQTTRRALHHIHEIEREWQERWRQAGYPGHLRPMLEDALKQRERADGDLTGATD